MKSINVASAADLGIETEAVCRFLDAHWKRRIALAIPSFYRWQFMAPPENEGRDRCCVAVDEEGALLGVMGLNERPFLLGGHRRKGAELTTLVVAPSARRRGVGKAILAYSQETYEVLFGMGIYDASLLLFRGEGFHYMAAIPRFVRVHDAAAIAPYARIEPPAAEHMEKFKEMAPTPYTVEPRAAASLAPCGEELEGSCNFFIRDAAHLAWRYDNHPLFDYKGFLVRDKGRGCAVILRADGVAEMRIVHVTDCFGDGADLPAALSFIDDHCRETGAHVADFYCTWPSIHRHFRDGGWFSILDDASFSFTHLFHPPELRDPPTTSLVYWAREDMDALAGTGRLYVTKEDLDLDRPTAATYEKMGERRQAAGAG